MKKRVPENKRFIELLKAHEALFGESIAMNKGKEILRKMNERTQNGINKTNTHKALDCFHRMDYSYQGWHPPAQLTAMVDHINVT